MSNALFWSPNITASVLARNKRYGSRYAILRMRQQPVAFPRRGARKLLSSVLVEGRGKFSKRSAATLFRQKAVRRRACRQRSHCDLPLMARNSRRWCSACHVCLAHYHRLIGRFIASSALPRLTKEPSDPLDFASLITRFLIGGGSRLVAYQPNGYKLEYRAMQHSDLLRGDGLRRVPFARRYSLCARRRSRERRPGGDVNNGGWNRDGGWNGGRGTGGG
jgi:hypothetical protein